MAKKYAFLSNSSGHIGNFCQIIYFLPKEKIIQKECGIKYVHKTDTEKEGGVLQMLTKLTKGEGGLGKC